MCHCLLELFLLFEGFGFFCFSFEADNGVDILMRALYWWQQIICHLVVKTEAVAVFYAIMTHIIKHLLTYRCWLDCLLQLWPLNTLGGLNDFNGGRLIY